ncbi:hypothetical protein GJW-30_1_00062 [Variibacter gotjawalensis]|uniref:Uncharacterized protein n=1 Tax=Variibacter gotjawalensis TaxID=1333996 RepID=A0A0S3PNQ9_9BRAD|nr:hypothetical protein EV661_2168 [Variibacter gotjawalensis]BAT57556.1 hypothetical protein GJW-30_1_00062 [Variibacter gotjawalensis]
MNDVPFHADLQHDIPPRAMKRYTVLSIAGDRVVSSLVNAATDEDAIAAVGTFFGAAAIEIEDGDRIVHVFTRSPDQRG